MSVIDDIKARADLVQYVRGRGVSLKPSGSRLKACCPFHADTTPSFFVDADKQTWHCFGACARGGDIIAYVMMADNCSFTDAIDTLCRHYGIDRTQSDAAKAKAFERKRAILEEFAAFYRRAYRIPRATHARQFAAGRGLLDGAAEAWGLGYAPDNADKEILSHYTSMGYTQADLIEAGVFADGKHGPYMVMRDRLVVPIYDDRRRLVALAGRTLSAAATQKPKWLNTTFAKSQHIFGLDRVLPSIKTGGQVVIVEGYLDVIVTHEAGHRDTVATMGVALTARQAELLRGAGRVVLALDGDDAGRQAVGRAIERLLPLETDIYIAQLPDGKDPDDLARAGDWGRVVDQAVSLTAYLIGTRLSKLTRNSPVGERLRAARAIANMFAPTLSRSYRAAHLAAIAAHLDLNEQEVVMMGGTPRTTPQIATPPEPVVKSPTHRVELYLLRAMIADPLRGYRLSRKMVELGLDPLARSDFPSLGAVWDVVDAAINQLDISVDQYMAVHAPDFDLRLASYEVADDGAALRCAIELRKASVSAYYDHLLDTADYAGLEALLPRYIAAHKV